jgi:CheY-like chemotaxis protein
MDSRIRVLIVEDEPIIAADLSRNLNRLGYAVPAIASRADEAFLAASAARPDVVLMDINLAGTEDGIEAATKIYSSLDIPVIFLTAHDDIETLQLAQAADPFGYLTKPATPIDLTNSIQVALTRYRKQNSHRLREIWLQAQLEGIGDGLIAASHDGTIRFINTEGERLLGVSGANVTGRSFTSAVLLRHRITGQPVQDLVRLAFLHGATMNVGEDYVVDQDAERKISGEIAISRVAGEPIGIVFTFRERAVQTYSPNAVCQSVVKADHSDCTRTRIDLNQLLGELKPTLLANLSSGKRLELQMSESVRPIFGNQQLFETVLLGLIERAGANLGQRGTISISTADSDFEQRRTDGDTACYVKLRVAYEGRGAPAHESVSYERINHQGLSIDLTMARVQSALQSLRATAQFGATAHSSYWDIVFPALEPILATADQRVSSAIVVLIEPDAVVRTVLCTHLTDDAYECLGARDAQEALDWIQIFPGDVAVIILPEEEYSPDIETLLAESPKTSLLLVRKNDKLATKLLNGRAAPSDSIDYLFSQSSLRAKLSRLLLARSAVFGRTLSTQRVERLALQSQEEAQRARCHS